MELDAAQDELEILKKTNIKLRTELAAQQAVCYKLKTEKKMMQEAIQKAEDEIR